MNRLSKVKLRRVDTVNDVDEWQETLYTYDKRGLVKTEVNALGGGKILLYDENGNLIQKTDEDGNITRYLFVYDYFLNVLAVNGKTGAPNDVEKAAAYELVKPCINDFINHFLGRTVDNGHIIGLGDADHKLDGYGKMGVGTGEAEADDETVAPYENNDIMVLSPGYFEQKHIYTDRGQRMEQKTDTAAQTGGNGGNKKLLCVHEDIMGNTRYHTKDNGQSYAELEYDIWGDPTSPNMLLNNDNGVFITGVFTGHIYDTVIDVYFAEARFYDAKNRQWLSSDPMKDGLNWYQYVRSNPATYWDPWGFDSWVIYVAYESDPQETSENRW